MRRPAKRLLILMRIYGKTIIAGLAFILLVIGVLWFQLQSLTRGASNAESTILQALEAQTLSLNDIVRSPMYLPYKFGLYLIEKSNYINLFSLRSLSAFFGLISTGLFYFIVSQWHSRRIALLGTGLFVTSSWFLHIARLGAPLILYIVTILCLIWCALLVQKYPRKNYPYALAVLFASLAIYTPGTVWIILGVAIWQRKLLWQAILRSHPILILSLALALIIMAPLAIGVSNHASLLLVTLGISGPGNQLSEWAGTFRDMATVPVRLAIRNNLDPVISLGRVALLDGLVVVMTIIGFYALTKNKHFVRIQVLVALLLFGIVMTGLSQGILIILLLPIIYILATSGLAWFLQQWFTVFPRNKLARTIGLLFLTLSLLLVGFYHLRSYFIAWPRNPATRAVFRELNH